MIKISEIIGFVVLFLLIVMCNSHEKESSKNNITLFKICKLDSANHNCDCRVYLFRKSEKEKRSFVGIESDSLDLIENIDTDTFTFYKYEH